MYTITVHPWLVAYPSLSEFWTPDYPTPMTFKERSTGDATYVLPGSTFIPGLLNGRFGQNALGSIRVKCDTQMVKGLYRLANSRLQLIPTEIGPMWHGPCWEPLDMLLH